MKLNNKSKAQIKPGMTLIELTVVILVLLTLISVLFIGAQAYKEGADRAACILNIRNVQQAMRSQMNMTEEKPGSGTITEADIIGSGKFLETRPTCPGTTTKYTAHGGKYPAIGVLYFTCDLATSKKHQPKDFKGW